LVPAGLVGRRLGREIEGEQGLAEQRCLFFSRHPSVSPFCLFPMKIGIARLKTHGVNSASPDGWA
jgi:hypothetical protein